MKELPTEITTDALREWCMLTGWDRDQLAPGDDAPITYQCSYEKLEALRGYLDRIVRAQSILEGRENMTPTYWERIFRCNPWLPTLIKYNPSYPSDTLAPIKALRETMGIGFHVRWCKEDIDMIWDCLPDWREPYLKLQGQGFIIDGMLSKHSSVYIRVSLPNGINYPCTIKVERFCDMDNLDHHGDYCPMRLSEDDEDYSDTCYCESWVERTETLILTEDQYQGQTIDAIKEDIRDFLYKVIWTDDPIPEPDTDNEAKPCSCGEPSCMGQCGGQPDEDPLDRYKCKDPDADRCYNCPEYEANGYYRVTKDDDLPYEAYLCGVCVGNIRGEGYTVEEID